MGENDDTTSTVSNSDVSEGSQTNVVVSSTLTELITDWVMEGLPVFEKLMTGLFNEGVIKDPTQQLLFFNVIGGFNHHFGEAWKLDFNLEESTSIAMSKMMANPAIGKMIESFMQSQVENNVMKRLI
jgi:hypothetical protein